MKKPFYLIITLGIFLTMAFSLRNIHQGLHLGDKIPMAETALADVSGKSYSLQDLKGENGLLVIFSCNTCPFVIAWEDRYNDLYAQAKKNKVGMVLINSNEAKRTGDDSLEAMKEHAKKQGYKMPYLEDKGHKLADAFGAKTTPHVYLFNKDGQLAYTGAIDDNSKNKNEVKDPYLKTALGEMGRGETTCKVPETKAVGCSIKRAL